MKKKIKHFCVLLQNFSVLLRNICILLWDISGLLRNFCIVSQNLCILQRNFSAVLRNFCILRRKSCIRLQNLCLSSWNFVFTWETFIVSRKNFVLPQETLHSFGRVLYSPEKREEGEGCPYMWSHAQSKTLKAAPLFTPSDWHMYSNNKYFNISGQVLKNHILRRMQKICKRMQRECSLFHFHV